jgi:hypothetical protein
MQDLLTKNMNNKMKNSTQPEKFDLKKMDGGRICLKNTDFINRL